MRQLKCESEPRLESRCWRLTKRLTLASITRFGKDALRNEDQETRVAGQSHLPDDTVRQGREESRLSLDFSSLHHWFFMLFP